MSKNNTPSPDNSTPPKPQPCAVCGKPFQNFPDNLVVISSEGGNAMLHVQLSVKVKKDENSPAGLPDFAAGPICIPCVHMIVGNAFRAASVKS
jgi:hypothetical protein